MFFKKPSKSKLILTGIIITAILTLADQISKQLIVSNTGALIRKPIEVIPGFFNIVSVRNTGAAWGMFHGNNLALLIIAMIALIIFALLFKSITEWYPERVYGFFMIISGILGNSIDRIFRGSVVDFLDFYAGSYHWPSFNIADSAICAGVFIIIFSTVFRSSKPK